MTLVPSRRDLTPPVRELLAKLPRIEENPYVFPGRTEGSHLCDYRKPWLTLLDLAGLPSPDEDPDMVRTFADTRSGRSRGRH